MQTRIVFEYFYILCLFDVDFNVHVQEIIKEKDDCIASMKFKNRQVHGKCNMSFGSEYLKKVNRSIRLGPAAKKELVFFFNHKQYGQEITYYDTKHIF